MAEHTLALVPQVQRQEGHEKDDETARLNHGLIEDESAIGLAQFERVTRVEAPRITALQNEAVAFQTPWVGADNARVNIRIGHEQRDYFRRVTVCDDPVQINLDARAKKESGPVEAADIAGVVGDGN